MNIEGTLVIVTQNEDYENRGIAFQTYNLMEYICLVQKLKANTLQMNKLRTPNSGGADMQNGRHPNGIFLFHYSHPQYTTHIQQLKSKQTIPTLAGTYMPKYPGHPPLLSLPNYSIWLKNANDFGSYFITLCVPYDIETKCTPVSYTPNWEGFNNWIEDIDNSTNSTYDNIGRINFIERCEEASKSLQNHRIASKLFRSRSACSKEDYLNQQKKGEKHGNQLVQEDEDMVNVQMPGNYNLHYSFLLIQTNYNK